MKSVKSNSGFESVFHKWKKEKKMKSISICGSYSDGTVYGTGNWHRGVGGVSEYQSMGSELGDGYEPELFGARHAHVCLKFALINIMNIELKLITSDQFGSVFITSE